MSFPPSLIPGYGNIAPTTGAGRAFCVAYALVGIPLTVLAIADLGKFLLEAGLTIGRRLRRLAVEKHVRKECLMEGGSLASSNPESLPGGGGDWISGAVLGGAFLGLALLSAALLPLWEEINFPDALYFRSQSSPHSCVFKISLSSAS